MGEHTREHMGEHMGECAVARATQPRDTQPLEAIDFRVGQRRGQVTISVAGADWNDAASLGAMLADFARQIGQVCQREQGVSSEVALAKMRTFLEAEWDYPTVPLQNRNYDGIAVAK